MLLSIHVVCIAPIPNIRVFYEVYYLQRSKSTQLVANALHTINLNITSCFFVLKSRFFYQQRPNMMRSCPNDRSSNCLNIFPQQQKTQHRTTLIAIHLENRVYKIELAMSWNMKLLLRVIWKIVSMKIGLKISSNFVYVSKKLNFVLLCQWKHHML